MKSRDVELALVLKPKSLFYMRNWLVVPNVSWGLNLHECDLLALSTSDFAHEIEIKVDRHDLKKDLLKAHRHESDKIRCLWFAGPAQLEPAFLEFCPPHAGIILVAENARCNVIRRAVPNSKARKFTDDERLQLARLGTMRYWSRYNKE